MTRITLALILMTLAGCAGPSIQTPTEAKAIGTLQAATPTEDKAKPGD